MPEERANLLAIGANQLRERLRIAFRINRVWHATVWLSVFAPMLATTRIHNRQFPTSINQLAFFVGTFFPFFRASERPIAMACFWLFTVPPLPPLPLFNWPRLRLCMALFTSLDALAEYFRAICVSPFETISRCSLVEAIRTHRQGPLRGWPLVVWPHHLNLASAIF